MVSPIPIKIFARSVARSLATVQHMFLVEITGRHTRRTGPNPQSVWLLGFLRFRTIPNRMPIKIAAKNFATGLARVPHIGPNRQSIDRDTFIEVPK